MQTSDQIRIFVIMTTAIIFLLAALIVTLLFIYQKRQLAYQRNLNNLKLDFEKNLLRTQVEIQEQTFQSISREIHDNINLSLTLAKLNLNTLDLTNVEYSQSSIHSCIELLGKSIGDLSDLSKSMNTDLIKNIGLMKAIKIEMDRLGEMARIAIHYNIQGEAIFLDSEKELIVFRIIQEAFNNILKHSKANNIWLQMDYSNHFLDIMIKDDGIGFVKDEVWNQKNAANAGLRNMHTRAQLFGGRVIMESKPKRGTSILVTVPYY